MPRCLKVELGSEPDLKRADPRTPTGQFLFQVSCGPYRIAGRQGRLVVAPRIATSNTRWCGRNSYLQATVRIAQPVEKISMQELQAPAATPDDHQKTGGFRACRKAVCRIAEYVVWGGSLREKLLLWWLGGHYASKFRRQWRHSIEKPHFSDHRIGMFEFAFTERQSIANKYLRGFLCLQMLRDGDALLDIGCGDGFFTRRFFAEKCSHIDAVDIEAIAVKTASAINSAPNIRYHLLDAVSQPFPRNSYSVIVWDGALGHFPAETIEAMLSKISDAVGSEGIFVGSEFLGLEGHDHMQFFHSLEALGELFSRHFKFVKLKESSYMIGNGAFLRREAYWRCSNSRERIDADNWLEYQPAEMQLSN